MALTDMTLSAAEAKEASCCEPVEGDAPKYPWGLALYLDDETLAKLGIANLPDVGGKMQLMATVEVTGNSQRQTQEGKSVSLDLQITAMELTGTAPSAATVLYGG